jgi:hypothetical protein
VLGAPLTIASSLFIFSGACSSLVGLAVRGVGTCVADRRHALNLRHLVLGAVPSGWRIPTAAAVLPSSGHRTFGFAVAARGRAPATGETRTRRPADATRLGSSLLPRLAGGRVPCLGPGLRGRAWRAIFPCSSSGWPLLRARSAPTSSAHWGRHTDNRVGICTARPALCPSWRCGRCPLGGDGWAHRPRLVTFITYTTAWPRWSSSAAQRLPVVLRRMPHRSSRASRY